MDIFKGEIQNSICETIAQLLANYKSKQSLKCNDANYECCHQVGSEKMIWSVME
jgi:hypothetical protein